MPWKVEAQAGITIPSENSEALPGAIRCLVALSREERAKMGRNGYAYVKAHYDTRELAAQKESVLQSAFANPRKR